MLVEVVGPPVRHERVMHYAGSRIEVPDVLAAQMVAMGRARLVVLDAPAKQATSASHPNHKRR